MRKTELDLDETTSKNLQRWLNENYDPATKESILKLIDENPKGITDAFYQTLSFGTGGMRGIMGVGTNRMNDYTVRAATQGLANYLRIQFPKKDAIAVCIGYDSRHRSRAFAEESAKVLAANGIRSHLFSELRPTPLISFACRQTHSQAAIMITASHNPPEYNGYKVYWQDGGQVVPPHDKGIIAEVNKISTLDQVKTTNTLNHPLITFINEEMDQKYLSTITPLQHYPEINAQHGKELKVVYTSLHGTGITLAPKALGAWGFTTITLVEKQVIPDGDFPTAKKPNPEEREALTLGIETLEATKGDILIATDPDADRVGVVVYHEGKGHLLTGNQVACLCLEHILATRKVPENGACIKTIGTSELFQAITDHYKRPCFNVLTGFKYIAEMIEKWEQEPKKRYEYIFGGEESYGYLLGTYTRDKDAICSAALICEVALQAKLQGKTLVDLLQDLFRKYGVYFEKLRSLSFDAGKEGQEQMRSGMALLRQNPPKSIAGVAINAIEDYQTSTKTEFPSGKTSSITLPKSNVLLFWLADKSKVMIRPSGTEPKVKIYCGVVRPPTDTLASAESHANTLLDSLKGLFQTI